MFFFLISFFIFSDHGIRLSKYAYETELGRREKKLPFISINIPKKLLNTQYFSNAKKNKDRLISFYDVYQTIRHFLYIQKGDSNSTQFSINDKNIHYLRGISLFNEIPINRSCNDALIPENHFSCLASFFFDFLCSEFKFAYDEAEIVSKDYFLLTIFKMIL